MKKQITKKFQTSFPSIAYSLILFLIMVFLTLPTFSGNLISATSNTTLSNPDQHSNIITIEDNLITLSNSAGCKLVIHYKNGKFGLGTFYFKKQKLGKTVTDFIKSDNHYIWEKYQATQYKIIKNTPEKGVIQFSGTTGKGTIGCETHFQVKISLSDNNTAYKIDCEVQPHRIVNPDHPLYIPVPFSNSAMQFVSCPFKTPLRAPFSGQWTVIPGVGYVPFIFGCEEFTHDPDSIGNYFVGIGYSLEDTSYTNGKGRLRYDTDNPELALRAYFPDREYYYGKKDFSIHCIVSTGQTQSQCIKGYMKESGFDVSTPIRRTKEKSISALMEGYRTAPKNIAYVPNKGYRGHVWSNSSDSVSNMAYPYVWMGVSAELAHYFYKYWMDHHEKNWARKRAFEMADAFVKSQAKNGAIPLVWKEQEGKYGTTHPGMEEAGYIYSPWMISIGAENLYKLCLKVKQIEGIDQKRWKKSALQAINWVAQRVEKDGMLGHTYDKNGNPSHIGTQVPWALLALDYFYLETENERYKRARDTLENWFYDNYARMNDWFSGTDDDCAWSEGKQLQYPNNDVINVFPFSAYCAKRYMETNKSRYLKMAKDAVWFGWLGKMPIEMKGYTYPTKGLSPEQYFWQEYAIPWNIHKNRCFPYLFLLTGNPFYAKYYKLQFQTMMAYQCYKDKYPFFMTHLAHHPNRSGPADRLLHQKNGQKAPWTIIFISFYLEDMLSDYTCRYYGGKDWGIGLDYKFTFNPDFGDGPFIVTTSTMLTSAKWNPQQKQLTAQLQGKIGEKGIVRIKWDSEEYPVSNVRIKVNDTLVKNVSKYYYESATKTLNVKYVHQEPTIKIKVRAK